MRPGPVIVQIGFNKCATRSIASFFALSGLNSVDWDRGLLARRAAKRMERGEDPFADYPDGMVFSDMEDQGFFRPTIEFYKQYAYILQHHPDAYFILNTRDKSDWLRSRVRHKNYLLYYAKHYRTLSKAAILRRWAEDWDTHHAAVQAFFEDRPKQFLVFDIDNDAPQALARLVAPHYDIDTSALPHRGHTDTKRASRWLARPGMIKPKHLAWLPGRK